RSEVEKARADELSKQAAWELEKSKEAKLRSQIQSCTIYAPNDGLVVYANGPPRNAIEEGATVRLRQKILMVPDLSSPMLMNTKVHESLIDQVRPGLIARVLVDAFPEEKLTGQVTLVSPLPDPPYLNRAGRPVKVYTALVRLDKVPPGLRPGM